MKFKKFMKDVGGNGKILTIGDDKWLVSPHIAMLIPDNIKVVLADIQMEAPPWFKSLVEDDVELNLCKLKRAIIPEADGKANSILRIFATDEGEERVAIQNPYYSLIETDDILNIYHINAQDSKALRVINYKDYKPKCVGFVLEYRYED